MRQIKHWLGKIGRLHDTAHFDGAFVFDEFANKEQESRRELPISLNTLD